MQNIRVTKDASIYICRWIQFYNPCDLIQHGKGHRNFDRLGNQQSPQYSIASTIAHMSGISSWPAHRKERKKGSIARNLKALYHFSLQTIWLLVISSAISSSPTFWNPLHSYKPSPASFDSSIHITPPSCACSRPQSINEVRKPWRWCFGDTLIIRRYYLLFSSA